MSIRKIIRGTPNLMTKLVIATFELDIGDPDRDARTRLTHRSIYTMT
jgi:hypothetical protein